MRFLPRLYITYVVLVLLAGLVVGGFAILQARRTRLGDIERRLQQQAVLVADIFLHTETIGGTIDGRLQDLGKRLQTRFTIIAPDGLVLGDSHHEAATMENHRHRPEIDAAFAEGQGDATRHSPTLGITMMYHAVRVLRDGVAIGVVRSALPTTEIEDQLQSLMAATLLAMGLAMAVALLLGLLFGRQITRPIHHIVSVARAFSHGDLGTRVADLGHDEIGMMGAAFNEMADQLADRLAIIGTERNRLRAILGAMIEGVIAVDRDERILHLNHAAQRLLEIRRTDLVGQPFWEHCRQTQVSEALRRVLQNGGPVRRELHLPQPQRDRHLTLQVDPIEGPDGQTAGAVAVLHDVTEFREMERIRRDFVTNASHELKTPLTVVLSMVETILDDAEMPEATRLRFLCGIRDQGRRLSLLINDLLTLSRLESTETGPERACCDLAKLVAGSCRQLATAADRKGVTLVCAIGAEPIEALVDAAGVAAAVENLVDNAIKYTAPGGTVRVTCGQDATANRIAVADDGIGITPADQRRIFERFYRVDKARSRELGGTGLGLAIAKHVVQTHGGTLTVQSQLGRGSTFTILLPRNPPPQPQELPS